MGDVEVSDPFGDLINFEMLTEVLKKTSGSEDVTIMKFTTSPTAGKGENWSSVLVSVDFTAKVNGIEKEYHWAGKFPPTSADRRPFYDATKMGEKETRFYAEFIPKLNTFIKESGLENDIKLNFPSCPFAELDQNDFFFFMENLKHSGYSEEFDKKQGLDMEHCKIVMAELARFHGVGHAFIMHEAKKTSLKETLERMDLFTRDYVYSDPTDELKVIMESFVKMGMEGILTNVEALALPGEDLVSPWKRNFKENHNFFDLKDRKLKLNEFNVLIHNDVWFNNMLFKYTFESGRAVPQEVAFVDLALSCWRSPVIDISYFALMSLTPEFREKHMDEILEYYHSELMSVLGKFGISPSVYSLSQLKEDYHNKFLVGLVASMSSLPAILLPKDQALDQTDFDWSDFEKMMEKARQDILKALQNNPQIRNRMRGNCLEGMARGHLV